MNLKKEKKIAEFWRLIGSGRKFAEIVRSNFQILKIRLI